MAKKRDFRKKQQDDLDNDHNLQEEESSPVKLETVLLGVVILILVFQTFLMLQDNGNDNSSTNPVTNVQPNNPAGPAANQPANPNPTMDMNQPDANAGPQATINFPESSVDFGSVSPGSSHQHTFTVENPSDIDIEFGRVYGDDGLTIVSSPQSIPAGGSGEIVVSYTAGSASGAEEKTVHMNANTQPPHNHLVVNATIQ